jgi:hypothetical protein
VSGFKPEQRHLFVRGRSFHFVTYEARPADPRRGEPATPALWYLMVEGHRCPVFPWDPMLPAADLDAAFRAWLADNALGPVEPPRHPPPHPARQPRPSRCDNWWGGGD